MARVRYHLLASVAVGTVLALRAGDWRPALASIVSGVLVDVDHVVDYVLARRGADDATMVVALHGWEYAAVLIRLDRRLGTRGGLTIAYLLHLVMDQIANPKRSRAVYSLVYRARRGFHHDRLRSLDPAGGTNPWRGESPRGVLRWL
jgi:hypothetical protein